MDDILGGCRPRPRPVAGCATPPAAPGGQPGPQRVRQLTAAGAHPGLEGPFAILEFDGDPTLVYLENRRGSAILEEDEDIDRAMIALQHLQRIALSPDDSLALLADVARELA